MPISASALIQEKEKQKGVWFNQMLKKTLGPGLDAPFRFDILAQLANIPAQITIHELLRLSKETKEALRDVVINSESFLIHMPEASEDDSHCALNVIMYTENTCHHLHC